MRSTVRGVRSDARRPIPVLPGLLSVLAGCATDPPPHPLTPRRVEVVERWSVDRDGVPLGTVERIRILDPAGPVDRYEVTTVGGQRAGFVDLQGRVFQRLPFEDREVFRGIHPMENALAMLYEVQPPVRIVPEEPAATPDSAFR